MSTNNFTLIKTNTISLSFKELLRPESASAAKGAIKTKIKSEIDFDDGCEETEIPENFRYRCIYSINGFLDESKNAEIEEKHLTDEVFSFEIELEFLYKNNNEANCDFIISESLYFESIARVIIKERVSQVLGGTSYQNLNLVIN